MGGELAWDYATNSDVPTGEITTAVAGGNAYSQDFNVYLTPSGRWTALVDEQLVSYDDSCYDEDHHFEGPWPVGTGPIWLGGDYGFVDSFTAASEWEDWYQPLIASERLAACGNTLYIWDSFNGAVYHGRLGQTWLQGTSATFTRDGVSGLAYPW